ncbi:hypothetical protein L1987_26221 [Smallanthus sonchifolius]|uniref:Uncharacterized protein n=1 Tax=Smallanthus sonchifolius TaxID=185202 RepID=A0ACB9IAJ5_9ASTR|nr:hypothetical protein L1987_26221 [Smallanthus sonchifolius]
MESFMKEFEHLKIQLEEIKSATNNFNKTKVIGSGGFGKIAPANQQHTGLFTNVVGTPGYCDPLYMETYFLTKESDVYSFGVLLVEEDFAIKKAMRSREERLTMPHVVEELEAALTYQELHERVKLPKDYKNMLLTAADPLNDLQWAAMNHLAQNSKHIFEQVADCISEAFGIYCKFSSKMLSPQTTYAAFLVYELPDDYKAINPPVQVVDENSDSEEYNIFLRTPETPNVQRQQETAFWVGYYHHPHDAAVCRGKP